jgi:hypothetical protein
VLCRELFEQTIDDQSDSLFGESVLDVQHVEKQPAAETFVLSKHSSENLDPSVLVEAPWSDLVIPLLNWALNQAFVGEWCIFL